MKPLLTKKELKEKLFAGQTMEELFDLSDGQSCTIFKAPEFPDGMDYDKIIYIPDMEMNEIPVDELVWAEDVEAVLSYCYTAEDFLEETDQNLCAAKELFWFCDWQNPSAAEKEIYSDSQGGFDEEGFFDYMDEKFGVSENPAFEETVKQIVSYGEKHERVSKDQFCYWLTDMIPVLSFGEVAMFVPDSSLTEWGQNEKKKFIQAMGGR